MTEGIILSTSSGYDWEKVRPWAMSALETGHHATAIFMNGEPDTLQACASAGVEARNIPVQYKKFVRDNIPWLFEHLYLKTDVPHARFVPHNLRFLYQYRYLNEVSERFKNAIITDSRDVFFTTDPFPLIEELQAKTGSAILCGSECLDYAHEKWGAWNLRKSFPYVHEEYLSKEIANVGVICGDTRKLAELCLLIFTMCIFNPATFADQSSFNVLHGMSLLEKDIHMCRPSDGLVVHLGTVGPTEKQGEFEPHLTEKPPRIAGGLPVTPAGELFPIVHQYDKVPAIQHKLLSLLDKK